MNWLIDTYGKIITATQRGQTIVGEISCMHCGVGRPGIWIGLGGSPRGGSRTFCGCVRFGSHAHLGVEFGLWHCKLILFHCNTCICMYCVLDRLWCLCCCCCSYGDRFITMSTNTALLLVLCTGTKLCDDSSSEFN